MSLHVTAFEAQSGQLYLLWSARTVDQVYGLNIFIAPLINPTTVGGPRVLIRAPDRPCENFGTPIVEAPSVVQRNGSIVIFSASRYDNPYYCVGVNVTSDPLVVEYWWQGPDGCAMYRNDEAEVWAVGHASFVGSPDNSETWILYGASSELVDEIAGPKSVRAERMEWDENGMPIFPRPASLSTQLEVPSGEV